MPLDPKSEAALNAMDSSVQLQAYFFSKAEGLQWLRPLLQRGYFDATRNPAPVVDEKRGTVSIFNWPALDYLERVAREASDKADKESASLILGVLHRVTKPESGEAVDNYRTWWKFAKVLSYLPLSAIGLADLELLQIWLATRYNTSLIATETSRLLSRFLASHDPADHRKALEIVKIVTHLQAPDTTGTRDDGKLRAVVDAYHVDELLRKNAAALAKVCGGDAVDILVERLASCVAAEDDDRYTYITRGAIEDNKQQNHDGDTTRGVLINAVRDVLLSLAEVSPADAQQSIETLLKSKYLTLKRIALYVIGARYPAVGESLWRYISPKFFRLELRHELYDLIKNNFSAFTIAQRSTLRKIIDGLTLKAKEPEKQAIFDASWRLEWLHAAMGQGDEELDQLYGKYLSVVGAEPTNPSFPAYMEAGWVGQKSPATVEDLAKMEIGPLASYLAQFQPTGEWGAPSEEGLGETLKELVKRDPARFANTLDAFVPIAVPYGYYVLRAFEELWNSKEAIAWQSILLFCEQLVSGAAFWNSIETSDVPLKPNRSWLTSSMSDLIKSGTRSDERAFDASLLPLAQEVLVEILRHQLSDAEGKDDDALNEAINTAKGRAVEALFNLALRRARVARQTEKDHRPVWEELKPIFDSELEKCKNANFEFSALAGNYVANLYFLSNDWTVSNINRIFSKEYERNWSCAMQGFSHVNLFYEQVYELLASNGHLEQVISGEPKGRHVRKKVLQQIAIAYIRGIESLPPKTGLFAEVLLRWKQRDLKELVWFFWTLRDQRSDDQLTRRIMDFWRWCYEKVRGNEEENAELLSKLTFFAAFLERIDPETEQWLLQAAPWAEVDYNATFLIETLDNLADQTPESVAKIYKAMLTRSTPTFDPKHIRSTIAKLYAAGLNSQADEICNTYAERGALELVRDIYEAHRRTARP